jgi:hypothetical protein
MSRTFNQQAFLAALEQTRASRAVSWRKVAQDTGIEVTALHRILNGTVPDIGKYIALTGLAGREHGNVHRRCSTHRAGT